MRTVRRLIRALRDEDEEVRAEAADRIGELGPAADVAIPALIDALRDEDPHVRCRVAPALGLVGGSSGEAELALEGALWDPDAEVRAAARILIARGAGDRYVEAVEAIGELPLEEGGADPRLLIGALLDDREDVRQAASVALADARMLPGKAPGPGIAAEPDLRRLRGLLQGGDPTVRIAAAKILAQAGSSPGLAITALLTCLIDDNGEEERAARAIAGLVSAPGALPVDLQRRVARHEGRDLGAVVDALGSVGVTYDPAFDAVAESMPCRMPRDRYGNFLHDVFGALRRTGGANPALVGILSDVAVGEETAAENFEWAISLLESLDASSRPSMLALIEIYLHSRRCYRSAQSWYITGQARHFLRREASSFSGVVLDPSTVTELVATLADASEEDLHASAAEKILRCTGALAGGVLDELRGCFGGLSGGDRDRAAFAGLGHEAAGWARPALLELLWDEDPANVLHAAAVLDGLDRRVAVESLVARLGEGRYYGRGQFDGDVDGTPAAAALGLLRATEAVPALVEATAYKDDDTRVEATRSLARILGGEAVPVLVALLGGQDSPGVPFRSRPDRVWVAAAGCLGELGPAARAAIPALEALLGRGAEEATALAVVSALEHIRGAGPGPPPAA